MQALFLRQLLEQREQLFLELVLKLLLQLVDLGLGVLLETLARRRSWRRSTAG